MFDQEHFGDFAANMKVHQYEKSEMTFLKWDEAEALNSEAEVLVQELGAPRYGKAAIWRSDVEDFDRTKPIDEQTPLLDFWLFYRDSYYPIWRDAINSLLVEPDEDERHSIGTYVEYDKSLRFTLVLWLYWTDENGNEITRNVIDTYTFYQERQSASWGSEDRKILFIPYMYRRNKGDKRRRFE